jgi:hypothetical protein
VVTVLTLRVLPQRPLSFFIPAFFDTASRLGSSERDREGTTMTTTPPWAHTAAAYPPELAEAERHLVAKRRVPGDEDRKQIGLGLSGGGIRSATFCLGILQALSRPVVDPQTKTEKAGHLLGKIDFLSTVSGGGFVGSFLGRLYHRDYVNSVGEVADILLDSSGVRSGSETFGFLRDNGRYLAPRGSGDLVTLLTTTLRNWIAVQTVLVTLMLTGLLLVQVVDLFLLERTIRIEIVNDVMAASPTAAFSPSLSNWFLVLVPIVAFWSIPTSWAYWVIGQPLSKNEISRRSDLAVVTMLGAALTTGAVPAELLLPCRVLLALAAVTVVWSVLLNWNGLLHLLRLRFKLGTSADEVAQLSVDDAQLARSRATSWFKRSVVACAIIVVIGVVDTLGYIAYDKLMVSGLSGLTASIGSAIAALVGFAAYGRQLMVLLGGKMRTGRPPVLLSVATWSAAIIVGGGWIVAISMASHGIAWKLSAPPSIAASTYSAPAVGSSDASADKKDAPSGNTTAAKLSPSGTEETAHANPVKPQPHDLRDGSFMLTILAFLLPLTLVLGNARTFVNLSTLHTFYASRLTRAYLGASNERRHQLKRQVTEVMAEDDIPATTYWRWPHPDVQSGTATIASRYRRMVKRIRAFLRFRNQHTENKVSQSVRAANNVEPGPQRSPVYADARGPADNGKHLHIVNVTINETFDRRTGVQRQDRKGLPMAVGPAGLSVGVRHHLVVTTDGATVALPKEGDKRHRVFTGFVGQPEPLTLGRWAGISGAAFTAAAGSRTTVPVAFLAMLANVRLGYWWDSGLRGFSGWSWLPPVYRALFSEGFASLYGTTERLWNVSDGGHFENLAGYELVRRELPLIILIDAEADPDCTFSGLAELVRKARLDFRADIEFLTLEETSQDFSDDGFGALAMLRRGPCWSNPDAPLGSSVAKEVPSRPEPDISLAVDGKREMYSNAHAAIARIRYASGNHGWLVYVKATLTGDEPLDVREYHSCHHDFPHETTADQFFDEAQWESYRRLGKHIGEKVLNERVFNLAR